MNLHDQLWGQVTDPSHHNHVGDFDDVAIQTKATVQASPRGKSKMRTARLGLMASVALLVSGTASGQTPPPPSAAETVGSAATASPPPPVASQAHPRKEFALGLPQPEGVFVDISPRWPADVLDAINGCKRAMTCPTLDVFKTNHDDAYKWVKGWCKARIGKKRPDDDETQVCQATDADTPAALSVMSILTLARMAATLNPPECSGFGLTVPLYSIRYSGGGSTVKGPVAAGLGGGYYWVPRDLCHESYSAGPEVFLYSEGLNPSGLFQVGIAAGIQLGAFKYFHFGLDLGYDLYRREPVAGAMDPTTANTDGLFAGSFHKSNLSVLLTFAVFGNATSDDKPKP